MIKFLLTIAILTASILSAKADGNDLLRECTSDLSADRMYCIGFVSGVVEARYADICVPNGVKRGQTTDIVVKFLRDYPQMRHYNGVDLVVGAVAGTFPCAKKASN